MAATNNTIINMTHNIRGNSSPLEGGILSPLELNWTQVASTSPSVDAPGYKQVTYSDASLQNTSCKDDTKSQGRNSVSSLPEVINAKCK